MKDMSARIESLQVKHATLSAQIEGKERDTTLTDSEILDIKRQKLSLKDEIARLKADAVCVAAEPQVVDETPFVRPELSVVESIVDSDIPMPELQHDAAAA